MHNLNYICLKNCCLVKKVAPEFAASNLVFLPWPFNHRMRYLSLGVDDDSSERRAAQLLVWARKELKERAGPTWEKDVCLVPASDGMTRLFSRVRKA
jgi:hypothetical protein